MFVLIWRRTLQRGIKRVLRNLLWIFIFPEEFVPLRVGAVSGALTCSGERTGARLEVPSLCSPKAASLLVTEDTELTSSYFSHIENKRTEAAWKGKKRNVGKRKLERN